MKDDLADARADPQGRWSRSEVRQLEGDLALEPGVDEACGGVNENRKPADAAAPLDARDEIGWNVNPLERRPERELARTEEEVFALADLLDFLGGLDRAPKLTAEAQVDAGGLKLELEIGERLDDDGSVAQPLTKVTVGQDHGEPPEAARTNTASPKPMLSIAARTVMALRRRPSRRIVQLMGRDIRTVSATMPMTVPSATSAR